MLTIKVIASTSAAITIIAFASIAGAKAENASRGSVPVVQATGSWSQSLEGTSMARNTTPSVIKISLCKPRCR
mgnify:CR=1 FL=1